MNAQVDNNIEMKVFIYQVSILYDYCKHRSLIKALQAEIPSLGLCIYS